MKNKGVACPIRTNGAIHVITVRSSVTWKISGNSISHMGQTACSQRSASTALLASASTVYEALALRASGWCGLNLDAADALQVQLALFDPKHRVRFLKEAVAFGLFLPGLELFERCKLYEPLCDELKMLVEHLDTLAADDLLLHDRGYPSAWLVVLFIDRDIPFCMRSDVEDNGFGAVRHFMRSGQCGAIVTLPGGRDAADHECPSTAPSVRLIRQVNPQGEMRVLMTSLFDAERFPAAGFAQLYHQCWRIEEAFKRIEHRLNLEHTSGLSWLAAWCTAGRHLEPDTA